MEKVVELLEKFWEAIQEFLALLMGEDQDVVDGVPKRLKWLEIAEDHPNRVWSAFGVALVVSGIITTVGTLDKSKEFDIEKPLTFLPIAGLPSVLSLAGLGLVLVVPLTKLFGRLGRSVSRWILFRFWLIGLTFGVLYISVGFWLISLSARSTGIEWISFTLSGIGIFCVFLGVLYPPVSFIRQGYRYVTGLPCGCKKCAEKTRWVCNLKCAACFWAIPIVVLAFAGSRYFGPAASGVKRNPNGAVVAPPNNPGSVRTGSEIK